jgi:hypothetical protein
MLRRLIILAGLTAGLSAVAVIALAAPALAKGPTQVRITGPGLARPIVVSGGGEPGQLDRLAVLATQTSLYTAMFGSGGSVPAPVRLPAPPSGAALGLRYTIVYTVPGVTPQPGQEFGRIQENLYPYAAGGPVIYIPPGQHGFGQPLLVTGWLRGSPRLVRTLARLGVPARPATRAAHLPAPAHQPALAVTAWLIILAVAVAAVAVAAVAVAGIALLRRRRPGPAAAGGPRPARP